MAVAETWLNESISNSELFVNGFRIHRIDRDYNRGGGILILVRNSLASEIENSIMTHSTELLHIAINRQFHKSLQFVAVYRPPNKPYNSFFDEMTAFLNNVDYTSLPFIIVGDMNINLAVNTPCVKRFKRFFEDYGFCCMNTGHTRVSLRSSSIIDVIIVNKHAQNTISCPSVLPIYFSDHCAVTAALKKPAVVKSHSGVTTSYSIDHDSVNRFRNFLDDITIDWLTADTAVQSFISTVNSATKNIFKPVTFVHKKINTDCRYWLTSDIRKLQSYCRQLASQAQFSADPNIYELLRLNTRKCNYAIRAAKRRYFEIKLRNCGSDTSRIWKILNNFISGASEISKIKYITYNDVRIEEPRKIANVFNYHFMDSVNKIASSFTSSYVAAAPPTFLFKSLSFSTVNIRTINIYFGKMLNKGCGPNSINHRFLKLHRWCFVKFCHRLTNMSLISSTFPNILKNARVIPLHKKGSAADVNNYRPVSVLPNFSKILECAVHAQIMHYLSTHRLLYENQHGFRTKHSTLTAVLSLVNCVRHLLDESLKVCVVFLDFSKAFDVLDHEILLYKCKNMFNFSHDVCNFLRSYLAKRSQFVSLDNSYSISRHILNGVPQGSILGPLLFLLYINDMHLSINNGNCIHFADDTAVVFGAKTSQQLVSLVNSNLSSISNYCWNNHLKINGNKTVGMLFNIDMQSRSDYNFYIDGTNIVLVDSFNYLGYRLDYRLSFFNHTEHISSIFSRNNAILQRTRSFLPIEARLRIFRAISMCHLHYCSLLYVNPQQKCVKKLHCVYLNSGCILYNCFSSALTNYKWPDLNTIFQINKYVFLYKVIKMNYSPNLCKLLELTSHDHNTRQHNHFKLTRFKHTQNSSSFFHWAPRNWNNLPSTLKSATSLRTFKKSLIKWLQNHNDV